MRPRFTFYLLRSGVFLRPQPAIASQIGRNLQKFARHFYAAFLFTTQIKNVLRSFRAYFIQKKIKLKIVSTRIFPQKFSRGFYPPPQYHTHNIHQKNHTKKNSRAEFLHVYSHSFKSLMVVSSAPDASSSFISKWNFSYKLEREKRRSPFTPIGMMNGLFVSM